MPTDARPIRLGDKVRIADVLPGAERGDVMRVIGMTTWLNGDVPVAVVKWVDREGEMQQRDCPVDFLERVNGDAAIGFVAGGSAHGPEHP